MKDRVFKEGLTVCVLTCDRPHKVYLPLTALLASGIRDIHLIILDNGNGWYYANGADAIVDTLEGMNNCHTTIIRTKQAPNNKRRQQALDICDTKYMLYLDDDVFFTPTSLIECLSVLREDKNISYVSCPFIDYKNVRGYSDFSLEPTEQSPEEVPIAYRLYRRYSKDTYPVCDIDFFDSGFVMFNVENIVSIGGWKGIEYFSHLGVGDTAMSRKLMIDGQHGVMTVRGYAYHILEQSKIGDGIVRNKVHEFLMESAFDGVLNKAVNDALIVKR